MVDPELGRPFVRGSGGTDALSMLVPLWLVLAGGWLSLAISTIKAVVRLTLIKPKGGDWILCNHVELGRTILHRKKIISAKAKLASSYTPD